MSDQGFQKIFYKGEEVKGYKATTTATIVMQKRNPDRLDMRYKCNKEFVQMNRAWSKKVASSGSELNLSLLGNIPYDPAPSERSFGE